MVRVLTEQEVVRSWRKLFKGGEYDEAAITRAETLLDELRAESPLRHRLTSRVGRAPATNSRSADAFV